MSDTGRTARIELDTLGLATHFQAFEVGAEVPREHKVFDFVPPSLRPKGRAPKDSVLSVRVVPNTGNAWIGRFSCGPEDYPLTRLVGTPCPSRLCVIARGAGFLVPVGNPAEWEAVALMPILDVRRVPSLRMVIFVGFQDVIAYGAQGLEWRAKDLAIDGLQLGEVTNAGIAGTGRDMLGKTLKFLIEPGTGSLDGGLPIAKVEFHHPSGLLSKHGSRRWEPCEG